MIPQRLGQDLTYEDDTIISEADRLIHFLARLIMLDITGQTLQKG